jgi:hypothetical protein
MSESVRRLFPLIVPVTYVQSTNWKLPHSILNVPDLVLTWVVLHEQQTMVYVTTEQTQEWERLEMDWRAAAMENLRRDTGENPATREKRDDTGKLQWVAMMQADGLGSSRILMWEELGTLFPAGYLVAIPERSVGLAIAADASPEQLRAFTDVVRNCHGSGITKMLDRLLQPADLLAR